MAEVRDTALEARVAEVRGTTLEARLAEVPGTPLEARLTEVTDMALDARLAEVPLPLALIAPGTCFFNGECSVASERAITAWHAGDSTSLCDIRQPNTRSRSGMASWQS